jgi:hypothetical protein
MPDRSDLRVVVVDDNYDANAALSRLLEKSGFLVQRHCRRIDVPQKWH